MDERARRIYQRAFATLDRLDGIEDQYAAEAARRPDAPDPLLAWDALREPERETLIQRTYEPLRGATMDAEAEARWNAWCQAHVERALDRHVKEVLTPALAEFVSDYMHERITKLREEMAALRADLMVQTAIARGEIKQLKGKTDAA